MKKSILAIFITLFLTACSDNSMKITSDDRLVLNDNSKSVTLSHKTLEIESKNFYTLNVQRARVVDSYWKPLFYENVTVDNDYELRYDGLEMIKRIFKLDSVNVVYKSNTLLFVQLEEEHTYINLIAQISSVYSIDYVYGFTNKDFFLVAQELGLNVDRLKIKNIEELTNFKSHWIQSEMILEPLSETNAGWSN